MKTKTTMKLKFYTNKEGEKVYTLKEKVENQETKDAHYKFLGLRDAPPSNVNIVRRGRN